MAIAHYYELEPTPSAGEIENTHRAYHSLDALPYVTPEAVAAMGRILCKSADFDHLTDSGWALMQAGSELRDPHLVGSGVSILKGIIQHTSGTPPEIAARIPCAIAPEYGNLAKGIETSSQAMTNRLHRLNGRVLALRHVDMREATGVAPEIATMYLLNKFFADNPDRFAGVLAWPAFPWQDRRMHSNSKANFDIMIGTTPHQGQKIQVKNMLEARRPRGTQSEDGDVLYERWRRKYHKDITLIFGDVHLGNVPSQPFAINRAIENLKDPANARTVRIATVNILDELGIDHDLSTASLASKPKLQVIG